MSEVIIKAVEGDANLEARYSRKIIFHYHLFKNAGTSIDAAFKRALLPEQWVTKEFAVRGKQNQNAVRDWIKSSESAVCFSSHTAELPIPKVEYVDIFPVIFIRHPIDRIASAYTFESKQNASTFGSTLARNTTLAGYIETRLSIQSDFQCRDFHAQRLGKMSLDQHLSMNEKVTRALEQLPFVGLVEKYDESMQELNRQLHEFGFTDMKLTNEMLNVSRTQDLNLHEKLEKIKAEVGEDLYTKLEAYNNTDIVLHEMVSKRFGFL